MTCDLIHIQFIDPEVFDGEWCEASEIADTKPEYLHAVGFLVHQDDDVIVLAGMFDSSNETYNAIHRYPKGCIKKLTSLGLLKCLMT